MKTLEPRRLLTSSPAAYAVRLARDASEVRAAQALCYAVFNLELNEGLAEIDRAAIHRLLTGLEEPVVARRHRVHGVAFLAQRPGQAAEQAGFVFNDQNSHRSLWGS